MLIAELASDLTKLLPEGANVVGVLIVVVLFLRQQDKFNSILRTMTLDFQQQNHNNQAAYQAQIEKITYAFQTQLNLILDKHIEMTTNTVRAVEEVQQGLTRLRDRIDIKQRAREREVERDRVIKIDKPEPSETPNSDKK